MIEFFEKIFKKLYEVSGFENLTLFGILQFIFVLIGVFFFELMVVGWERSSMKKILEFNSSTRTDFVVWILSIFNVMNLLAFVFTLGTCYFLVGLLQKSVDLRLSFLIENIHLQFAVVFILSDFKEYVSHVVFHRFKPFWAVHEFHHSATNFNIFTAYRFHFLQSAFSMFFSVVPLVILGVPLHYYFALIILRQVHGLIIHSNIEHSWGWIGRNILVSPIAHRIHHSVKPEHFDKNFGGTFIFWDRIFGTYHAPTKITELGIPNNPYNKKNPFYDFYISMKRLYRASINLLTFKSK